MNASLLSYQNHRKSSYIKWFDRRSLFHFQMMFLFKLFLCTSAVLSKTLGRSETDTSPIGFFVGNIHKYDQNAWTILHIHFLSFFHPEDKQMKPLVYKRSVGAAVDWVSTVGNLYSMVYWILGQLFVGNASTFKRRRCKYNQVCWIVYISGGYEMTNLRSMADLNDELDRLDKQYEVTGMPFEYDF